eukprot:177111_1
MIYEWWAQTYIGLLIDWRLREKLMVSLRWVWIGKIEKSAIGSQLSFPIPRDDTKSPSIETGTCPAVAVELGLMEAKRSVRGFSERLSIRHTLAWQQSECRPPFDTFR